MLRIGVCDDMPFHANTLAEGIACWQRERNVVAQVITFQSGEDLLCEIESSGDFSAVFLDIRLNGMSGIETAIKIRKQSRLVSIVFVSLYDTYYREMHNLAWPILFLEKPFSQNKLYQYLDQIVIQYLDINKCFHFTFNHRSYTIDLHKVLYFASDRRVVTAVLEEGIKHKMYHKLDYIEHVLKYYQNFFIRIHQSYLVNTSKIMKFHRRMVTLCDKNDLPVSRGRKNAVIRLQMEILTKIDKIHQ